jgi:hypothetical protein
MGEEFAEASDHNEKGFYEERSVVAMNEALLMELGMAGIARVERWAWRSTVLAVAARHREELRAIAARATGGWKDPHFTVTLEAWLPVLPSRPRIVVCLRSPAAYAQSVTRVWGLVEPAVLEQRWARQYRRLLHLIRDYRLEVTCVEYDTLLAEPEETVRRLSAFVGHPLDASHIDPGLRRFRAPLPSQHQALYDEVLALGPAPVARDEAHAPAAPAPAPTPLDAEAYLARSEALIDRVRASHEAWAARVDPPPTRPDGPAREATAAHSALLLEAQEELATIAPPPSLRKHHELSVRFVNLQRLVAECALAVASNEPPDPQMVRAAEESWRRFGRPEAFEELEAERRRAAQHVLQTTNR